MVKLYIIPYGSDYIIRDEDKNIYLIKGNVPKSIKFESLKILVYYTIKNINKYNKNTIAILKWFKQNINNLQIIERQQ